MVREAVEQRGGHLGITENGRPFTEGEIGRDDDRGTLVETADQVEQQLAARLRERQITQLVEDDEVEAREMVGKPTLSAGSALGFKAIDEIDELKKRPREPARMQLRVIAIARCVLPVPVPPTRKTITGLVME